MLPLKPFDAEIVWSFLVDLGAARETKAAFEQQLDQGGAFRFTFGGSGALGGIFQRSADPMHPFGEAWLVTGHNPGQWSRSQTTAVAQVNAGLDKHLIRCHAAGRI